jgi:hypothetical protein
MESLAWQVTGAGQCGDAKQQTRITAHVPVFVLIVAFQALARYAQGLIITGLIFPYVCGVWRS